jgi:DNA-binding IscR family transcriptional regulator
MENQEIILKAMKDASKPVKAGEIAETTGLDAKIVTKELGKMKKEGKVVSPKVCFYTPA